MSRDVQYNFVYLHAVQTPKNIYSLTLQDDETGQKHSSDKLEWYFMDHPIDNYSTSGSANEI
jgi:hypothetical protein